MRDREGEREGGGRRREREGEGLQKVLAGADLRADRAVCPGAVVINLRRDKERAKKQGGAYRRRESRASALALLHEKPPSPFPRTV